MTPERISARLADHPTVRKVLARKTEKPGVIDADWLRQVCLDAGADDVAFASVDNPDLAGEREHVDAALPGTQSFISLVVKMNRDNVRSTARSVANLEFHHTGDLTNEVAHRVARALEAEGVRAVNPAMGFPMEMDRFPGKIWVVSHKPVAVAAGLGQMGIHRNVIHPKFGNFILLGTVLIDAEVEQLRPSRLTTRAWSASCAWRRARSGPSPRTATSTSRPALRTTTGSSWAASPIGRAGRRQQGRPRLPHAGQRLGDRVDVAEPRRSGRTTRRRTAWRSARRART